jgi:hypothetical protein
MASSEWYYARGDRRLGPVPVNELKRLAAGGDLRPEDLVWRDGMADWAFARNVKGLFGDVPAPPPGAAASVVSPPPVAAAQTPADGAATEAASRAPDIGGSALPQVPSPAWQHPIDVLLTHLRRHSSERFVETASALSAIVGHVALGVAALALVALWVIVSVASRNPALLLSGGAFLVMAVVLQYVASRFFKALDRLRRNTPSTLFSTVMPDSIALLALAGGVMALVSLSVAAVITGQYGLVPTAVLACIFCEAAACVALCLPALNVTLTAGGRASQEALGVLSFLVKFAARLAPMAYGLGVTASALRLGYAAAVSLLPAGRNAGPAVAQGIAMAETAALIYFATLPLVAYVAFLIYHLLIDVIRALLGEKS